jgi:hypothetical protein
MEIIWKAMAKSPADRFATCEDFSGALLGSTPAIRSLGAVTDKQMIVGDLRVDERLGAELLDQRNDRRDRAPFRALC